MFATFIRTDNNEPVSIPLANIASVEPLKFEDEVTRIYLRDKPYSKCICYDVCGSLEDVLDRLNGGDLRPDEEVALVSFCHFEDRSDFDEDEDE